MYKVTNCTAKKTQTRQQFVSHSSNTQDSELQTDSSVLLYAFLKLLYLFVMVALCNTAGHYIFILWFLLLSFFFPRLIIAVGDWMSTILPHMVWP